MEGERDAWPLLFGNWTNTRPLLSPLLQTTLALFFFCLPQNIQTAQWEEEGGKQKACCPWEERQKERRRHREGRGGGREAAKG